MNVNAHQVWQVSFIMCKELQSMQTQWNMVCWLVSNKRYAVVQELVMGFVILAGLQREKHVCSAARSQFLRAGAGFTCWFKTVILVHKTVDRLKTPRLKPPPAKTETSLFSFQGLHGSFNFALNSPYYLWCHSMVEFGVFLKAWRPILPTLPNWCTPPHEIHVSQWYYKNLTCFVFPLQLSCVKGCALI